jgi:hypothetical protein
VTVNDLVHELLGQIEEGPYARAHCIYCGARCYGRTCACHRDLAQLEHAIYTHPFTTEAAASVAGSTAASAITGG